MAPPDSIPMSLLSLDFLFFEVGFGVVPPDSLPRLLLSLDFLFFEAGLGVVPIF